MPAQSSLKVGVLLTYTKAIVSIGNASRSVALPVGGVPAISKRYHVTVTALTSTKPALIRANGTLLGLPLRMGPEASGHEPPDTTTGAPEPLLGAEGAPPKRSPPRS